MFSLKNETLLEFLGRNYESVVLTLVVLALKKREGNERLNETRDVRADCLTNAKIWSAYKHILTFL